MSEMNIDQLNHYHKNPRLITEKQFAQLSKSLKMFGDLSGVVVDLNTHEIISGNQRINDHLLNLKESGDLGKQPIEIVKRFDPMTEAGTTAVGFININGEPHNYREVRWTPEQAEQANIQANRMGGMWDKDILANQFDQEQLLEWGFELYDFEGAASFGPGLMEDPAEEDDEAPSLNTETEAVIKPGDLITLGDHLLLCGDATLKEHVETLMGGQLADMVFTDPPYGVNVKGGKNKGNIIAGDLTQTAIPFSFEIAVKIATKPKARFYFCGGEGNIGLYYKLFERYLGQMPRLLIWVKNGFVMKPNGYHNGYELIFYGYKTGGGGTEHWYSGRKEDEASDVWKIKRDPTSTYKHPTQKPVDLSTRAITNHSKEGDIVFEPFCGSGSTLIACQKTGRKCYAMELDAHYCDVIVQRYVDHSGNKEIIVNGEDVTWGDK